MPIGLVNDYQFEDELASLQGSDSGSIKSEIVEIESPGRKNGDVNIPDALRQIIGETSVIDGRKEALKLAREFGVSPSSVSAYAKGATSTKTYDTPSKSIISHINRSRQRAIKRASSTLNSALSSITQEKLDYADAKDLSSIAKDMSVVIKNLEPSKEVTESNDNKQPQFVIFAPSFRDERTFETITVNE